MGYSIEVNSDNFETEVLQKSSKQTVLVDFFATWCGPCQLMKPLLEKLVEEYDFILAKVDIDKHPDLAQTYSVEGVPDVRIVQNGEVLPGFVGALNEAQLRQLVEQLCFRAEVNQGFAQIKSAILNQNLDLAQNLFQQLLKKYPNQPDLTLQAALFLIEVKQTEQATQLLATISEDQRAYYPKAQALKQLIEFQTQVQHPGESEVDQLYAQACRFTLDKNYPEALKTFLEVVKIDRNYKDDGARKAMLSLFELLGDDHPLTKEYRKQLMLQLY